MFCCLSLSIIYQFVVLFVLFLVVVVVVVVLVMVVVRTVVIRVVSYFIRKVSERAQDFAGRVVLAPEPRRGKTLLHRRGAWARWIQLRHPPGLAT